MKMTGVYILYILLSSFHPVYSTSVCAIPVREICSSVPGTYEEMLCTCPPGLHVVTHCNLSLNMPATCQLCPRERYSNAWTKDKVCRGICKTDCANSDEFELLHRCPFQNNLRQCKNGTYQDQAYKDYCRPQRCDETCKGCTLLNPDDRDKPPNCVKNITPCPEFVETVKNVTNITKGCEFNKTQSLSNSSNTICIGNNLHNVSCSCLEWKLVCVAGVLIAVVFIAFVVTLIRCYKKNRTLEKKARISSESHILLTHVCDCMKTQSSQDLKELVEKPDSKVPAPASRAPVPASRAPVPVSCDDEDTEYVVNLRSKFPSAVIYTNKNMDSMTKIRNLSSQMSEFTEEARARGAKPVKIAVIDTGANLDHPHIKNLCINRQDCVNVIDKQDRNDLSDPCGHGTKVLSIIYQMFEDHLDCIEIVIIKAVKFDGCQASLEYGDFVRAINYLQRPEHQDIKLVTLSAGFELGPGEENTLSRLVNDFIQRHILIAASSNIGNWKLDTIAYPAKIAISVGSLNSDGVRSKFSPKGSQLHFMTIGEGFNVANAHFRLDDQPETNESWGTSLAAPVVACFAANVMLQLEYHMKGSGLNVQQYREVLETTNGMKELLKIMAQRQDHNSEMGYGALLPDDTVFYNRHTYIGAITRALDSKH